MTKTEATEALLPEDTLFVLYPGSDKAFAKTVADAMVSMHGVDSVVKISAAKSKTETSK